MTVSEVCWQAPLATLVDQLSRSGDLRSPPWRAAFDETPRHVFVPTVILISESGPTVLSGEDPAQRQSWLDLVYSDTSLVTKYLTHPSLAMAGDRPLPVSTSSSTMPGLMARMLEALDVHDGHRVLEIGTGTGYNAALLCHRLGSANVVSIDIDPALTASAKDHLASIGHHPTLMVGDGAAGVARHAPYDRIIATAAVPDIPLPWIEQLAPGGRILANLRGDLAGGTLCLLTKHGDDEVIGPALPLGGHFMWLRPQADSPLRAPEPSHTRSSRHAARTSTALDAATLVDNGSFRFLLQLHLRGARGFRRAQVYDPRTRATRVGGSARRTHRRGQEDRRARRRRLPSRAGTQLPAHPAEGDQAAQRPRHPAMSTVRPAVVAISGPIGAGKTTVAALLADRLGWPRTAYGTPCGPCPPPGDCQSRARRCRRSALN
ncbi:MAG: methyltransferase domain-containing protein [Pseudonocardiaceae bacterium]